MTRRRPGVDALELAHGGTIAVRSAPGPGTAFTLRLPLAPQIESANRPVGELARVKERATVNQRI